MMGIPATTLRSSFMSPASLNRRSLIILAIGFLVLFVGGGQRFAIGLVLKPIAEDLDWARGIVGAAAAIFLVIRWHVLRVEPSTGMGKGLFEKIVSPPVIAAGARVKTRHRLRVLFA